MYLNSFTWFCFQPITKSGWQWQYKSCWGKEDEYKHDDDNGARDDNDDKPVYHDHDKDNDDKTDLGDHDDDDDDEPD